MSGTVYGRRRAAQRDLYEAAVAAGRDLRTRLEALVQLAHRRPVEAEDVEAVKAALFAAHGW